jgi:hypothetical protein
MSKIHDLTTLEIKVFSNAHVYAALQAHLPQAGGRLLGAFASDIGELSQVLILREFDDAQALVQARLALLNATDPLGTGEWLVKLSAQSYQAFPWAPPLEPAELGRWYEFRQYSLRQGTLAQTIEAWREAVPARHAMSPMVGVFTALDGEQPRFLNIWAYQSVDERARIRAQAVQNGVWPPQGGPANLTRMVSTLCTPLPFSPLR